MLVLMLFVCICNVSSPGFIHEVCLQATNGLVAVAAADFLLGKAGVCLILTILFMVRPTCKLSWLPAH